MARKLTEQERENVEALRATLTEALPPAQRGIASGIASALVRVPADTITEDDLSRILGKYEEADASVAQVVRDTLLDAVEGQKGTYTLRIPEGTGERDDAAAPQEGELPSTESPMEGLGVPEETPAEEVSAQETVADQPPEEPEGEVVVSQGPAEDTGEKETDGTNEGAETPSPAEGAPSEASEEKGPAPVAKPKRVRRRAPRTHKTAKSVQEQREQQDGEPQAQRDGSDDTHEQRQEEPKRKDAKGRASKGKDAGAGKGDEAPKDASTEKADKDKSHRKDLAASRDLKKVPYVRRGGETEAEVRHKILGLDQRFWVNGWLLSHPAAYTLYERELVAINDALSDGMLPGDITRRQLAYQMGGDEKFFEYGSDGFKLLRAMGMEDVIRHRPMPKPDLVYYAPRRRKHMRVLVTENLDPYLDVHDLMYEDGRTSILGQRIHAVVLGGGTPILEKNRLALLLDTLGADTITVLYWGDIDRAGLEIMVKLKDVLGDGYKFRAFTPAYQLMVDKAQERFPDPADNESTGQVNIEPMDASLLVKGLTDEAAAYAKAVIDDCGLIPQEILTRRDL